MMQAFEAERYFAYTLSQSDSSSHRNRMKNARCSSSSCFGFLSPYFGALRWRRRSMAAINVVPPGLMFGFSRRRPDISISPICRGRCRRISNGHGDIGWRSLAIKRAAGLGICRCRDVCRHRYRATRQIAWLAAAFEGNDSCLRWARMRVCSWYGVLNHALWLTLIKFDFISHEYGIVELALKIIPSDNNGMIRPDKQ